MKTLYAIVIAVFAICIFDVPAGAATTQLSSKQLRGLEQALLNSQSVRVTLGTSFDIVRVQPVGYRPNVYVVDAAIADRSKGIRVLVDLAASAVVKSRPLDPAHILLTAADAATAFALVRNLPSVRAALGATLSQYAVAEPMNASRQRYRVEALPVRSTAPRDPCTTHRCLELLFHTPQGYVKGLRVLVDLTAGHRIDAPREAPTRANVRALMLPTQGLVRFMTSAQSAASIPVDCKNIKFVTATTSWSVCWYYVSGHGLVIGPASFHKQAFGKGFNVIGDARVDEIFVPYASGDPRFFDTSFDFPVATITQSLCLKGTLLDGGNACLEMRDRDVDWMAPLAAAPPGRRGEEAVLWSVLYAANYLYIEQWGFRDDGIFWGRVGATGQNLPGIEFESHAHDYVWRIVPHLAGKGNSVNYVAVNEPVSQLTANDITTQIVHPTGVVWGPQRFDQLEVYAPGVTNGRGDLTTYRLIPLPTAGLAHHFEPFTQADLWATEADPLQLDASELPAYAKEHTSLVNADVALWYRGSFRHQPRDEDGYYDSGGNFIGTTHTAWTGFLFMPRNLFEQSPLF